MNLSKVKGLKYYTTKTLNTIMNDQYKRSKDGSRDYQDYTQEIDAILWARDEKAVKDIFKDHENELMEYEAFLDSEGVPPIPDCALL
jgi:predicted subunit of tRNA(5-methylaminomethyl-2-thiouridylate) methyltransferase